MFVGDGGVGSSGVGRVFGEFPGHHATGLYAFACGVGHGGGRATVIKRGRWFPSGQGFRDILLAPFGGAIKLAGYGNGLGGVRSGGFEMPQSNCASRKPILNPSNRIDNPGSLGHTRAVKASRKSKTRHDSEQGITPDFISQQVSESDCFFLDLNPSPQAGFSVTCGGLEHCNTDYRIQRNRFQYFGLEYIIGGTCSLTLDGITYQLRPGCIFCYGPRTRHEIRNTGDGPLIKYFVDFTGPDVAKVIGDPFLRSPVPYQLPQLRSMHALFQQILETGKQGGQGCQRILRKTLELIAMTTRFKAIDLMVSSSGGYLTFTRIFSHIEANYARIRSIEKLASECHISCGHMARLFKKFSEESPWQMVVRLKMNRAAELLLSEDITIKSAANRISFDDAYHFSRAFKKYFGMAPRDFREAMGKHP